MVERGGGAGLGQEPLPRLGAVLGAVVGDLQRHPALELGVLGQVDRAHPPLPQPLDDPVPAELLGEFLGGLARFRDPGGRAARQR